MTDFTMEKGADGVAVITWDVPGKSMNVLSMDGATALNGLIDDALADGAQALVVHHPLLLRGVHGVGADTVKGALLHRLVRGGCALFTAHTNADQAVSGVSESLALALGLTDLAPIRPAPAGPLDKIVVFAPVDSAEIVRTAAGLAAPLLVEVPVRGFAP